MITGVSLMLAASPLGALSITDYSVVATSCAGSASSTLSFSTPIGIQYRVEDPAWSVTSGSCQGSSGAVDLQGERGYWHVATDWDHPFALRTHLEGTETWRPSGEGCIGMAEANSFCEPPAWHGLYAGAPAGPGLSLDRLRHYRTLGASGNVVFYGVNELSTANSEGSVYSHPATDVLLEGRARATSEGEAALAFGYSMDMAFPSSLSLQVFAKSKSQTTVNVPMPHATLLFIEGQLVPGVFEALPGCPAPRTYKNPSRENPRVRAEVSVDSFHWLTSPTSSPVINGSTFAPDPAYADCDDGPWECDRVPRYHGAHADLLNGVLLARAPLPPGILGSGTKVIGELVTFEIVPATPTLAVGEDPMQWAFAVASRLGRVVKRQLVYAEAYHGGVYSCTPPGLSVPGTLTAKRHEWVRLPLVSISTVADEPMVVRFSGSGGVLQTNATVAGVVAAGSGTGEVSLQGTRSALQTALSQRIVWYRTQDPLVLGDSIGVSAWRVAAPSCKVTRVLGVSVTERNLLNIDLGLTGNSYGWSDKIGPAAIGFGPGDIWEAISYYYHSGLLWSDGTSSGASISLNSQNAATTPSVGNSHPDAMFNEFNVRADNTPLIATIGQLPAGTYDVYVYAHRGPANGNSRVTLKRAGVVLGMAATTPEAISNTEQWSEGRQYVCFRGIQISAGQSLELQSSGPSGTGSGCINGLQVLRR